MKPITLRSKAFKAKLVLSILFGYLYFASLFYFVKKFFSDWISNVFLVIGTGVYVAFDYASRRAAIANPYATFRQVVNIQMVANALFLFLLLVFLQEPYR